MKRTIENIEQLREEISRLEQKKIYLKSALKNDVEEIKEELNPLKIIAEIVSRILGLKIHKELFTKDGMFDEIISIIKQIFLRSSSTFFANNFYGRILNVFSNLFSGKKRERKSANL